MDLSKQSVMNDILIRNGFTFKKSLGQNFLIDGTICPKMADCCVDGTTGVIEIGPGAGILTRELCKRAKKVVAVELDERLKPVLAETTGEFHNISFIYADVLKISLEDVIREHFKDVERVCVCANLPYYITSPVIIHLLKSQLPIDTITVMIQKEAADRICAHVGDKNAGSITVAVRFYSESRKLFDVSKKSFFPSPKVDSAVVQLKVLDQPPVDVKSADNFFKLSKALFAQRRKTLINTVSNTLSIDKSLIRNALNEIGLPETVRGETLKIEQIAELSDILFKEL